MNSPILRLFSINPSRFAEKHSPDTSMLASEHTFNSRLSEHLTSLPRLWLPMFVNPSQPDRSVDLDQSLNWSKQKRVNGEFVEFRLFRREQQLQCVHVPLSGNLPIRSRCSWHSAQQVVDGSIGCVREDQISKGFSENGFFDLKNVEKALRSLLTHFPVWPEEEQGERFEGWSGEFVDDGTLEDDKLGELHPRHCFLPFRRGERFFLEK